MARNEEKAMTMLNRWYTQKKELGKVDISRPKGFMRIQKIESINTCEKWRNSIVKEISKLMSKIQNAGLGEYKIRELNDEINDKLKEKSQWDNRIVELGGNDTRRAIDADLLGTQLEGQGGYKYFGAAKDLPGVRELFSKPVPDAPKKQGLTAIYKNLDFDFYLGNKIENESDMKIEEKERENDVRREILEKWIQENKKFIEKHLTKEDQINEEKIVELMDLEQNSKEEENGKELDQNLIQSIQDNKQKTAGDYILEQKKSELLEKYFQETQK